MAAKSQWADADDAWPPLHASDHYVPNWYVAARKEEKQIRKQEQQEMKAQEELEMEEERNGMEEERNGKRETLVVLRQDVQELNNKLKATEIEKQKLEQNLLEKQEALEQKLLEKQKLEKEYQDMAAAVFMSKRNLRLEKAKFKACQQEEEQCLIDQAIAQSLAEASAASSAASSSAEARPPQASASAASSSASAAADELPIGWTAHVNPQYGETYYHNAMLGVSQWERPGSRADLQLLDQRLADFDKKFCAAEETTCL
jgi:chromosome segregation ATPase